MRKTSRKRSILRETILEYIDTNAKLYIIVIIMFLIGILLGIIFINNCSESQSLQISEYINNFINSLKENCTISTGEVLKKSIANNFFITLILWFLGSTVIGIPLIYLIVIYKGYSIGYTAAAILATLGNKGIMFILASMILQYIIYIPCILSLAVSGINLYKLIREDRRTENVKVKIAKHTVFCTLIFCILVVEAMIEAYVSSNLIMCIVKIL